MPVVIVIDGKKYKVIPNKKVKAVQLHELKSSYSYRVETNNSYFGYKKLSDDELVNQYVIEKD